MAETMTFEEGMAQETTRENMVKVYNYMETDSVVMKLIEAAKTVEDMYEAAKHFVQMKFEDFKLLLERTADYFSSPKAVLPDEMLDSVAGGWSFGSLFSSISKKAWCIAGCVAGAVTALGSLAGMTVACTLIATTGPVGVAITLGVLGIAAGMSAVTVCAEGARS